MLGTYGEVSVAVMVYAATLGLAGLVNVLMMRYALRHRLVRETDRKVTEPFAGGVGWVIPGFFLVSIPIALLSPLAAELVWLGALVGVRRQRRVAGE